MPVPKIEESIVAVSIKPAELSSAGLIDTATIDSSIFGTGKFYKEQSQNNKEDIYSNIEKAIDETPNSD